MVTIDYGNYTRLGNNMLQYAAAGIFARKHDYYMNVPTTLPRYKNKPDDPFPVSTGFGEPDSSIKVESVFGGKYFDAPQFIVNNSNYLELLKKENIDNGNYHFRDFFQIKEFILEYTTEIRNFYKVKFEPRDPKEVFVAFRLGDATLTRSRLPYAYYNDALTQLYDNGCKGGFVTSENIEHPDIQRLIEKFGLKPYINHTPMEKINFAKDFNNLVLSEGSFSFWMGFLSNAQNVFVNNRRHLWSWHGDIFVVPHWKQLCYDTPELIC